VDRGGSAEHAKGPRLRGPFVFEEVPCEYVAHHHRPGHQALL